MLKLNASYSKKIPAESEYSSQSYHAQIEVELPDGLTQEQLQSRIHETFALVRESVEAELHGSIPAIPVTEQPEPQQPVYPTAKPPASNERRFSNTPEPTASPKQLKYLIDLARGMGWTPQQVAAKCGVQSVQQISRRQCSELINSWKEVA